MSGPEGLDNAEYLILGDLEDSPKRLQEFGWPEAPSRQVMTGVLGPALLSLTERNLIEVRRFRIWPARWEEGVSVSASELQQAVDRVDEWSGTVTHGVLAVRITQAGVPYL